MKRRVRPWHIVLIGGLAIVLGYVILSLLHIEPNGLAAIASAIAALAAMASAYSSSETARDAVRALSYATQPVLRVTKVNDSEGEHVHLKISNVSLHAISRASIQWRTRDGRTDQLELGPLPGRPIPPMGMITGESPSYPPIELGPHPGRIPGVDQITIDYWGPQGSVGWRRTLEWRYSYREGIMPDGRQMTGTSVVEKIVSEHEI